MTTKAIKPTKPTKATKAIKPTNPIKPTIWQLTLLNGGGWAKKYRDRGAGWRGAVGACKKNSCGLFFGKKMKE